MNNTTTSGRKVLSERTLLLGLTILISPSIASADMVWPALFLTGRMWAWWAILIGLVVEYGFVRWKTFLSPQKALLSTIAMNAASTLLGTVLIPLAGVAWEIFPGLVLYELLNIGTFNPGTWAFTVIAATVVNSLIEAQVLRRIDQTLPWKRSFRWLCAANAISVCAAFVSLLVVEPRY